MRQLSKLIFVLILLTSLEACQKDEPFLTLKTSDSLVFSDNGGSETISLETNTSWRASSSEAWCKISPDSGDPSNGRKSITVTCNQNMTFDKRQCVITIKGGDLSQTVSVNQESNVGAAVNKSEFEIDESAQTIELDVTSNINYSIKVDSSCEDWISLFSTKAPTQNRLVFNIAANKTYDTRTGKILILREDGSVEKTVSVTQHQMDGLLVTTSEYNISNASQNLSIEIKANVDYEVSPQVDWIHYNETRGLSTSTLSLTVDANDTYDSRTGIVTLKQKTGDLSETITINQDEGYGLLVSTKELFLSGEAQIVDIDVNYNVEYDVIIPEEAKSWLSISGRQETRGLSSDKVSFSIEANDKSEKRIVTVTFKQKDGALSSTVLFSQDVRDSFAPLTFEAVNDGSIVITNPLELTIEYLKDGEWRPTNEQNISISISEGEAISFRGNNNVYSSLTVETNIQANDCYIYGNIMSLIDSRAFTELTKVSARAFKGLFRYSGILSHPRKKLHLPASELAESCYHEMFYSCSKLTSAPDLPATTLAKKCYYHMFSNCTALTCAPDLPATSLANSCYFAMFMNCVNLVHSPEILPATSLEPSCYEDMFSGCTKLTEAPSLPAETLSEGCYRNMFLSCSNLTTAPDLPAHILSNDCYAGMFMDCTHLVNPPSLPAKILATGCYQSMFRGCRRLEVAPVLPAKILLSGSYSNMFYDCLNLKHVEAAFISGSSRYATSNWLAGVAEGGTFIKNSAALWDNRDVHSIPESWSIESADYGDLGKQFFFIDGVDFGEKGSYLDLYYLSEYPDYKEIELDMDHVEAEINGKRQPILEGMYIRQVFPNDNKTSDGNFFIVTDPIRVNKQVNIPVNDSGYILFFNNGRRIASDFLIFIKARIILNSGESLHTDWIPIPVLKESSEDNLNSADDGE